MWIIFLGSSTSSASICIVDGRAETASRQFIPPIPSPGIPTGTAQHNPHFQLWAVATFCRRTVPLHVDANSSGALASVRSALATTASVVFVIAHSLSGLTASCAFDSSRCTTLCSGRHKELVWSNKGDLGFSKNLMRFEWRLCLNQSTNAGVNQSINLSIERYGILNLFYMDFCFKILLDTFCTPPRFDDHPGSRQDIRGPGGGTRQFGRLFYGAHRRFELQRGKADYSVRVL